MGEQLDFMLLKLCGALDRALWRSTPPAALLDAGERDGVETGATIAGRYEVLAPLGEGAFGRVWKVKDTTSDKVVALKELIASGAAGEAGEHARESILQLEQEFFSLSKLQHPNIVRMIDYGSLGDEARYVVMELVSGQDLYQRLQAGPLPRDEAAKVLIGLIQALHLLHSRLYVHCDIKAENVRITDRGEVKLMDFGLLHQLGTPSTQVRGTPHYMAPEVVTGGVIDARTDLYSVGVLAYELFTGSLPFDGETTADIISKHLHDTPREPSYFLDLPAEIDAFVLKLLHKEPRERFQNAAEALTELARISGVSLELAPVSHRTSYLYSADLVGRSAESQTLDAIRRELGEGHGTSVFICGRGGEGKTRLLEEFRLRVKLDKVPWAAGQCREEGLRPLQPMVDALAVLLPRTSAEQLAEHGPVLALMFPELVEQGFSPPQFANPAQAKLRLHETVAGWLADLAASGPLALCLEDLHLADGATLELLNFLIRARQEAPIAYVATFRSNEVDRTSVVYATVDEELSRLLELAPLRSDDVSELLSSTLRDFSLSQGFVGELFDTTGGNAFFVIETLRYLVEGGTLGQSQGVWQMQADSVELPADMHALVERRLGFLDPELLDFCRSLAPIGRALDIKLTSALTRSSSEELFGLFEQLVERQYVQRAGGQFFFNHASVRDAIYASTDEDKRRDVHQALGELLSRGAQASGQPAGPGQLAYHFKRGRDPDRAIDCFLDAARESMAKQQLLEATMLLGEGADLLEASSRPDRETLLVSYYDLMAPAGIGTHPPSCLRAASRLLEIWGQRLDPARVAVSIRTRNARAASMPGPLKRLWQKPEPIFDRLLQIKGMQGMAFAVLGMPEPAIKTVRELVELLPDSRSPLHAVAAVPEVLALFHMGQFEAQRATARRAMVMFEAAGERLPPPLRIFWFLSTYLYSLSEALEGRVLDADIARRATDIAERFDMPMERGFAILPHLVRAALRGDPDGFATHFASLEEITRRLGNPHALTSRFHLWLPTYYLERGEIELARATSAKIEGMGKATRDAWLMTYAKIYQGLDSLQTGAATEADTILEQAVALARERKLGRLTTALCARGQALSRMERGDQARACLDEALRLATSPEQGSIYDETVARRLLADLEQPAAARDHLERSIAAAEEMDSPIQQGKSWYALARLRARSGDGDARAALSRAATQFEAVRNQPGIERVAALTAEIP